MPPRSVGLRAKRFQWRRHNVEVIAEQIAGVIPALERAQAIEPSVRPGPLESHGRKGCLEADVQATEEAAELGPCLVEASFVRSERADQKVGRAITVCRRVGPDI